MGNPNMPKFLFVGTAKAGTTSIYQYLQQHPDIEIPVKETFYFLKNVFSSNRLSYPRQRPKSELILSEKSYLSLYEDIDEGKIVGEIGTGYLYHFEDSVPVIKEMLGDDVRICIILRNPVDRCFSSYLHFIKDLHEEGTFEDALDAEEQRKMENWDFMWHHKSLGLYARQVAYFQNTFSHVKIWLYDDLRDYPVRTMDEIIAFLGAPPKADWSLERVFNPSGKPKNARLQKFITHENPVKSLIRPLFRALFSKEKRERMRKDAKNNNLEKVEGLTSDQRQKLNDYYREDIEKLEKLANRDLSHWISP